MKYRSYLTKKLRSIQDKYSKFDSNYNQWERKNTSIQVEI